MFFFQALKKGRIQLLKHKCFVLFEMLQKIWDIHIWVAHTTRSAGDLHSLIVAPRGKAAVVSLRGGIQSHFRQLKPIQILYCHLKNFFNEAEHTVTRTVTLVSSRSPQITFKKDQADNIQPWSISSNIKMWKTDWKFIHIKASMILVPNTACAPEWKYSMWLVRRVNTLVISPAQCE